MNRQGNTSRSRAPGGTDALGDPRLSLEERYKDHEGYVQAVAAAARRLEERRLLLPEDVQRYVSAARASPILRR